MYEYQKLPGAKVNWPRGSMHAAFLAAASVVMTMSLVAAAQMLRENGAGSDRTFATRATATTTRATAPTRPVSRRAGAG